MNHNGFHRGGRGGYDRGGHDRGGHDRGGHDNGRRFNGGGRGRGFRSDRGFRDNHRYISVNSKNCATAVTLKKFILNPVIGTNVLPTRVEADCRKILSR